MPGRCRCCCRWACRHREECYWRWPLDCPCRVVPAIWVNLWGLLALDYKTGVLALVPEHWTSHALARAHEAAFCILRDDDDAHDAVQDARVNGAFWHPMNQSIAQFLMRSFKLEVLDILFYRSSEICGKMSRSDIIAYSCASHAWVGCPILTSVRLHNASAE